MKRTVHPRQEFLASPSGQAFAESVTNPGLIEGVRAALLEFIVDQPRGSAWEDAARSHHYVQGAKDFATFLLTFIDSTPEKPQPVKENLKWPTKSSLQQRPPPKA